MKTIILFLISFNLYATKIPGIDLINYFGSTCPSQGEWTSQALNDSLALIDIVNKLQNDPDCRSISSAVLGLQNLRASISRIENISETEREIAKLEGQEQELLRQLNQTSDPDARFIILDSLTSIQTKKAGLLRLERWDSDSNPSNLNEILIDTISVSEATFSQLSANFSCIQKAPNILPMIGSLGSAIASAATTFNPALSVGLGATTEMLGLIVEAIRNNINSYRLYKLATGTTLMEGMKCVLESFSERWCDIQEAKTFLKLRAQYRYPNEHPNKLVRVFSIFETDIPVLLDWLEKVRAGIPPSSSSDSERQKRVFEREAKVRSAQAKGQGILSENRPLFLSSSTPADQWNVIKLVINNLDIIPKKGWDSGNGDKNNPLFDILPAELGPYYLLGLDALPTFPNGTPIPFSQFDPFIHFPNGNYRANYDLLDSRYNSWVDQARDLVNRELDLVLRPDPLQLISLAFDSTNNIYKRSAHDSLDNIVNFLNKNPILDESEFKNLYRNTQGRLTKIQQALDVAINTPGNGEQRKQLEIIFDKASLQYGTTVIGQRLEMIVRISLLELFKTAPELMQGEAAQFLSAESFTKVLSQFSGTDNFALILADLQRAEPIVLNNIEIFTKTFRTTMKRVLKDMISSENKAPPSLSQVYRTSRTQLCFGLLASPQWPRGIPKSYCEGLQIDALIPGGPDSVVITKDVFSSEYTKRSCLYREFIEDSKIYQDWGIKL